MTELQNTMTSYTMHYGGWYLLTSSLHVQDLELQTDLSEGAGEKPEEVTTEEDEKAAQMRSQVRQTAGRPPWPVLLVISPGE